MARFTWTGNQVAQNVKQHINRGLFLGASHIHGEALDETPLDEGTLSQTSGVDVDEGNHQASIYYTQKYAVRLHEHPEYNFQRGRKGKYLEDPFLREYDTAQEIIANEVRRAFR